MATTPISPRSLPQKPSAEYLRKEAKRLARGEAMQLAAAQRRLAHNYGHRNWAALMTAVQTMASPNGGGSGANDSQQAGSSGKGEGARNIFPLFPLRGLVAFPHVSYPIFLGRPKSIKAAAHAYQNRVSLLLVAQRSIDLNEPTISDRFEIGTIGDLMETLSLPDGTMKCVVEGQRRARVTRFIFDEEFFKAEAEAIEEPAIQDPRLERITRSVVSAWLRERVRTVAPGVGKPEAFGVSATTSDDVRVLADRIASELRTDLPSKQALLEILDPLERLESLLAQLNALS